MNVYTSIEAVPLDVYSVPDVGDTNPVPPNGMKRARMTPQPPNPNFVIPFTRIIKLNTTGLDVVGAKRAIWRHNSLPIPTHATKLFGPTAVQQLKVMQERSGLKVDGQLGEVTLKKLAPWFDQLAYYDYVGYAPGGSREEQIRSGITAYVLWGYNNRPSIYYSEFRPMEYMNNLYELPVEEDCSTFGTKSYKSGKALDPNYPAVNQVARGTYNGTGNTATMRANGKVVTLAAAKPGDLCHYDNPQHVMVYLGNARCGGLGSDPGPLILDYNYRPLTYIMKYTLYKGMN